MIDLNNYSCEVMEPEQVDKHKHHCAPQQRPGNIPERLPSQAGFITAIPTENGTTYHCNIEVCVGEMDPYFKLLNLLYTEVTAKDTVVLHLFSFGGSVSTGCQLITAMLNTVAHVKTVAHSMCASIAAIIWCCGKERIVTEDATLMFHMPSGCSMGKTADNEEESRLIQEFFKSVMIDVTKGILLRDELEKVIDRRNDIYIPGFVIMRRLIQQPEEGVQ